MFRGNPRAVVANLKESAGGIAAPPATWIAPPRSTAWMALMSRLKSAWRSCCSSASITGRSSHLHADAFSSRSGLKARTTSADREPARPARAGADAGREKLINSLTWAVTRSASSTIPRVCRALQGSVVLLGNHLREPADDVEWVLGLVRQTSRSQSHFPQPGVQLRGADEPHFQFAGFDEISPGQASPTTETEARPLMISRSQRSWLERRVHGLGGHDDNHAVNPFFLDDRFELLLRHPRAGDGKAGARRPRDAAGGDGGCSVFVPDWLSDPGVGGGGCRALGRRRGVGGAKPGAIGPGAIGVKQLAARQQWWAGPTRVQR